MNHRAHRNVYPEAQPKGWQEGRGDKPGMTLREHYAGLALQGALAAGGKYQINALAQMCVQAADALLEELGK